MNREEHLDVVIEQQLHGDAALTPASDEEAALFAAVEALARLNQVEAPPNMAARIQARIQVQMRTKQNGRITSLASPPRGVSGARHPLYRRPWVVALTTAAVLVLACLGVVRAASTSLPGDLFYGVKQFEQQVALANTSNPADRARLQISQLQSDIADLETEVNTGRSDHDITQALSVVATQTQESQSAVASLPAGAEHDAIEQSLEQALSRERTTLYTLLARVDWSLRLAFTSQLGTLGAPIPTVTQVTVAEGSDDTLTLTLTGTNFAPGALLVINGTPRGTVSQDTSTKLIAQVNGSDWPDGTSTVGVLNPDGTATQVMVKEGDDHHDGAGNGGDQGTYDTPGPCSTPGSGDGQSGDHNGSGGGSEAESGGKGSDGGTCGGSD